jgi:hypothetical protein
MAISWVALFAPESPMFLYEKGRFEDLAGCLTKIASVNGTFDALKIERMIEKLKKQKLRDTKELQMA